MDDDDALAAPTWVGVRGSAAVVAVAAVATMEDEEGEGTDESIGEEGVGRRALLLGSWYMVTCRGWLRGRSCLKVVHISTS